MRIAKLGPMDIDVYPNGYENPTVYILSWNCKQCGNKHSIWIHPNSCPPVVQKRISCKLVEKKDDSHGA